MKRRKERGSDGPAAENENARDEAQGRRGEQAQDETEVHDEDRLNHTEEDFGGNRRERRRDRHE